MPPPQANTALYTVIAEARHPAKSDAGFGVSLVVFTDGENDVNHTGDDRGLLGNEGLALVKDLSASSKIPITTVGFGVGGKSALVTVLRDLAWPSPDSYYNAETNAKRLGEIFSIARKRLTDRIQVLFDPAREYRDQLAGQSLQFRIQLKTSEGGVPTKFPALWNAPAIGVPVSETTCSQEEARAIRLYEKGGPKDRNPWWRLIILGMFGVLLAALWFGAPRLVWPESYIPRPTFNMPSTPNVPGVSTPSMPRASDAFRSPPPPSFTPSAPRGVAGAARTPVPSDQTIVIKPRSGPRPAAAAPRSSDPPDGRAADDETIYRPLDKDPRKGR